MNCPGRMPSPEALMAEADTGRTSEDMKEGRSEMNPDTITDNDHFPHLEETLSVDRFGTYLAWAGDNRNRAVSLYTLNTTLSESLYTPLHILEVALRNRIHQVMTQAAGDQWYDLAEHQLNSYQADMLAEYASGVNRLARLAAT